MQDDSTVTDDKEAIGDESAAAEERRRAMAAAARRRDMRSQHKRKTDDGASQRRRGTNDLNDKYGLGGDDSGKKKLSKAKTAYLAMRAAAGSRTAISSLILGGGFIAVVIGLFFIYAQYKLVHTMEGMERHFFSRNNHAIHARQQILMREFIFNHLDGENLPDSNANAPFAVQVFNTLYKGDFKKRLEAQGVKITRRKSLNGLTTLVTIEDTRNGTKRTYDQGNGQDRRDLGLLGEQLNDRLSGDGTNRIRAVVVKAHLSRRLGYHWHPLDPIRGSYAEVRAKLFARMLNPALRIPALQSIASEVLKKFFGDTDEGREIQENLSAAIDSPDRAAGKVALSAVITETTAKFVKNANLVGLAILAADVGCRISDFLADRTARKLVQKKIELEQMGVFRDLRSAADQQKDGKNTDANTVSAAGELLAYTDKDGKVHDISESNNYSRQNGRPVEYHPSTNCEDNRELCLQKQASKAMRATTLGSIFEGAGDLLNSPFYKALPLPLPGTTSTVVGCTALRPVLNVVDSLFGLIGRGVDTVLSNTPGVNTLWSSIKDLAGDFITMVSNKFIGALAGPSIDIATTRGPALLNVAGAGASLAAGSIAGSPAGTDETLDENVCYNKTPEEKKQDTSLCGKKLTRAQLVIIDNAIVQENHRQFNESSLWTRMASLDTPYSFASRIAFATPSSPKVLMQRAGTTLTAAINPSGWMRFFELLPNLFTPKLQAVGSVPGSSKIVDSEGKDQFGTDIYGFEEADVQSSGFDTKPHLHNLDTASGCSAISDYVEKKGRD
ncbi:MAG TPA: hypothetical protein VF272_01130, partial [Candidatus Saccharimonadia bacterium]